jgi:hypothetical protein
LYLRKKSEKLANKPSKKQPTFLFRLLRQQLGLLVGQQVVRAAR